mmetsp:Transcript_85931/g.266081  ORF Transcript_85931/g.266081 Transcript_85931/m.266081 type:complete len:253 (+) Transcript_85931:369-1127(+)
MACLLASSAASFLAFLALSAAFSPVGSSSSSSSRLGGLPPARASTSACDSLTRWRAFSGCASTFRSALCPLALAARSPNCCFTERSCSASVLVGCQPPRRGSSSARSAGTSEATPPFFPLIAGSRNKSFVDIFLVCFMASNAAASAASSAAFASFAERNIWNRSRSDTRFAGCSGSLGGRLGPDPGATSSLWATSLPRPNFRSFFQSFLALARPGASRSSRGASSSCSSRSQTSWEITGWERTAPPSARSMM